jgi:hypothetical protein
MSKTRNNHYVPQWYQEGFFEPGRSSLAFMDTTPDTRKLPDGRMIVQNGVWNDTPTSRAFCQKDLYSTFFGTSVNDEIERRLFGDIDGRGSQAVRAFSGTDKNEWHNHFQTFFEYLDTQKIRTPKGLEWLKAQYPKLSQNELMLEMQEIRNLHSTIWVGGVREIISAENSEVKFIFSDHPVTIYNHSVPPTHPLAAYPRDPGIELKASQTIFPLNRNLCLILTNLEYAQNPAAKPLEKRTFARNFRQMMTRIDAFIRSRQLTSEEVGQVNFVIKSRARRYIAGGRKEWLYPEKSVSQKWGDLRKTFQPPANKLHHFGGEMFVKYESGHVHYQDEFGRTEKPRDFLTKPVPAKPLRPSDICGCGSGSLFKACCEPKPEALRPSWHELSIRERNLILRNGIVDTLGLNGERDWIEVRRELTDEKIRKIYSLYEGLWPLETDLLALLPKPDGAARAVYTGSIDPRAITDFALAAPLYFGELIVAHPFVNSAVMAKEFRPTEHPGRYRQDVLKSIIFFLTIMPLVELGLVNLIPDPCDFDFHLREQMWRMSKVRASTLRFNLDSEPRLKKLMDDDRQRILMSMPADMLRRQILKHNPEMSADKVDATMRFAEHKRELDPLAVLQEGALLGAGGQMNSFRLLPNFEIAMYLAQATGASIVTDSPSRWREVQRAIRGQAMATPGLRAFSGRVTAAKFAFLPDERHVVGLAKAGVCTGYPELMRDLFGYLTRLEERGPKPNREVQLIGRFPKIHDPAQQIIAKAGLPSKQGRISCALPPEGIQDNTINRLLLMSSSEHHLSRVPMAFFVDDWEG